MIYIVIPVHNRKAYTLGCLADLTKQTLTEKRVIVVDDGSTDGTAELVARQFPDVIILTGNGSLWWAGAMNFGIRYVLDKLTPDVDDFILALNDDIQVRPDYLASLLTAYQANLPLYSWLSISRCKASPHIIVCRYKYESGISKD